MRRSKILVRAFDGQPLEHIAIGIRKGLVYVTNPDLISAIEKRESGSAGFPNSDIFLFDSDSYMRLRAEWESYRHTETRNWHCLFRCCP